MCNLTTNNMVHSSEHPLMLLDRALERLHRDSGRTNLSVGHVLDRERMWHITFARARQGCIRRGRKIAYSSSWCRQYGGQWVGYLASLHRIPSENRSEKCTVTEHVRKAC